MLSYICNSCFCHLRSILASLHLNEFLNILMCQGSPCVGFDKRVVSRIHHPVPCNLV